MNWASPTPGASEVGLPRVIARLRFHLRPALKLPEQHFHFSAVVCILMIHLQPASRSPTGRQLSLAFSRFICSVHRGPPPYHFHFSALSTVVSPVLGATDAYCTLQLSPISDEVQRGIVGGGTAASHKWPVSSSRSTHPAETLRFEPRWRTQMAGRRHGHSRRSEPQRGQ